jgi:nitronate monooxygenase
MRDWVTTFRSSSNGAFQINLWVPDEPPVRDAAHEAAVRQVLSGLAGAEVPEAGDGPFLQDFAAQCTAMLEAAPATASSMMGLFPPEVVAAMKARGMKWIANATTVAEALAAQAAGADAVVAQGSEAGGHRGSFVNAAAEQQLVGLFALLPQMADALDVPVVAAGGIMDGRAMAAALTLGASAVQLGTAFLRCPETALHPAYAEAVGRTRPEDTVMTRGFSGRLARGIRNQVTEAFAGALKPAPYPVQRALMAKVRDAAAAANDGTRMQAWAGQGAPLSRAEPAGEVVRRVWAQAAALLP